MLVCGPQMVLECVCVCVCVCGCVGVCVRNEPEVCTTLAYPHISSFCARPVLYPSTHMHASSNHLRSKPTGLKVDTTEIIIDQVKLTMFMDTYNMYKCLCLPL